MPNKNIEDYVKDFWKYASKTSGVHQLEDVFLDWAKEANISLPEFRIILAKIDLDVQEAFGFKEAAYSKKELLQDLLANYNKYLFGIGATEVDPVIEGDISQLGEGETELGGEEEASTLQTIDKPATGGTELGLDTPSGLGGTKPFAGGGADTPLDVGGSTVGGSEAGGRLQKSTSKKTPEDELSLTSILERDFQQQ